MVCSCARTLALLMMVCGSLVTLQAGVARAQEGDPFGAPAKTTLVDDDPFGTPAKHKQVAATNPPETPRRSRPTSTNERVRSVLNEVTRMEFVDAPLIDAINFLKDYHQVEIQLDERALKEVNVGSDTPVTRNLNAISLKSALRLLLSEMDLAYVVQNDVLLITTKDMASEMREVRVYDVTKLVAPSAKADEIGQALTMLLSETPQQMIGGGSNLPELKKIRIVPLRDMLVIRASQDEHDEIAAILQELAKALPEEG